MGKLVRTYLAIQSQYDNKVIDWTKVLNKEARYRYVIDAATF